MSGYDVYGQHGGAVASTDATVSGDAKLAGDLGGFTEFFLEGYVRSRPNVSTRAVRLVELSSLPSRDAELEEMLRRFPVSQWRREFARYNKMVVDPNTGMLTVVRRVPGLTADPLVTLGKEEAAAAIRSAAKARRSLASADEKRKTAVKPKQYLLAQVLEDTAVQAKYGLSEAYTQLLRRQAAVDSGQACRQVQEMLRDGGFDCVVQPGQYSDSVKASRNMLVRAAESLGKQISIDLIVIGNEVFCEGKLSYDESAGAGEWTVRGPSWRTPEIIAVSRLVFTHGVTVVNQLFELHMARCGVRLIDGELAGLPIGSVTPCYGPVVSGISGCDGSTLSGDYQRACERVVSVVQADKVVGTAVRYTSEHVLVNWHVIEQVEDDGRMSISLGGGRVLAEPCEGAGYDLWLAKHENIAFEPWLRRGAVVGEKARMVYRTLCGSEVSDVVTVLRIDSGSVVTTMAPQARVGLSGAALVAERDGALLAVFHGYTYDKCVFAVVTGRAAENPEVHDMRKKRLVQTTTEADELYMSFSDRGMEGTIKRVFAAMVPLYQSGVHVGVAVNHAGRSYTTLNPYVWDLATSSGDRLGFVETRPDLYTTTMLQATSLDNVRKPVVDEQVCVLATDVNGPYFSQVLTVHRTVDNEFWLGGIPASAFVFQGGLVVAISDGVVLGQYVMQEASANLARCVTLAQHIVPVLPAEVVVLGEIFPGLNVPAWDPGVLSDITQLEPVALSRYCETGRVALRNALTLQLARQRDESLLPLVGPCVGDDTWLVNFVFTSGLTRILGTRAVGATVGKVAEAFLAIMGLAAVSERADVFADLVASLKAADAVRRPGSDGGSSMSPTDSVRYSGQRPLSWGGTVGSTPRVQFATGELVRVVRTPSPGMREVKPIENLSTGGVSEGCG